MLQAQWSMLACHLAVLLSSTACGRSDSGAQMQTSVETPAASDAPRETTRAVTRMARLTPEQVSRVLKQRLNYETGWVDGDGVFHDAIKEVFAVPLGGVDFATTFERDPSPKVQTILVARALAWNVAAEVIYWEIDPKGARKTARTRVLTTADLATDFPAEAAALFPGAPDAASRDARWRAQLDDLYWRLFARPPRTAEVSACAMAFAAALKHQPWPPAGWNAVLYALLSTAEFWNLWGET